MSPTQTLISVEEYLSTSYRPDCDYIDGKVLERNMGEKPHARLQIFFARFFAQFEDDLNVETLTEQRLQTGEKRYRIPDVMLAVGSDKLIVSTAPLLCIEILSSEDRMKAVQERIDDYARMGVPCSWVVDPCRGTAFTSGPDAILHEVGSHKGQPYLTVPRTPISIEVDAIFAELDRLERRAAQNP
jgi:Uma2 family endonuclease